MRHAMVGAVAATSLLLSLAVSAAAQTAPPKPADAKETPAKAPAKAPEKAPAKTPEKAPSPPGKSIMEWDRATGDWGGSRTKLFDKGIDLNARLTDDFTRVQGGGADPYESANRYWIDVNLSFDLNKLAKFTPGGTVFVSFWQFGGENGSKDFGAVNAISSIESEFRQELAEFYYANVFLKDAFDTRIGKMDPTERFNHSEYADDFMNRAATYPVTFFPSPYRPETAFGADLFYRSKGLYAGLGLFDGAKQEGVETGHGGTRTFFGDPGDLFLVTEAGYRWTNGKRPIRAAVGYWRHSGDFTSLSGRDSNGSSGWFAMAEGMLTKKNKEDAKDLRGTYLVLRYGSMEENTSPVDWTSTVAFVRRGTFESRKSDSYGVAWSVSSVSPADPSTVRYSSEQVVEFFYKAQVTPFFSVAPGVQYVANPAGTFEDALVFGLRVIVDF